MRVPGKSPFSFMEGDMSTTAEFLRDRDVAARYDITRAAVWRLTKRGELPEPLRIGGVTRWRLEDLERREAQQGTGEGQ